MTQMGSELIQAVAIGGSTPATPRVPETLEQLYPRLLRFAAASAPAGVDATDIVQEALAKTLTRHPDFRGIRNIPAYLYRATANTARSSFRSRVGRDRSLGDVDQPGRSAARDDRDEINRALRSLAPRQRACIYLRFIEDRSVQEVSRFLGCSQGTVKSQTAKALGHLALELNKSPTA